MLITVECWLSLLYSHIVPWSYWSEPSWIHGLHEFRMWALSIFHFFIGALSLHIFICFIEALPPSLIDIAIYRTYWYCRRKWNNWDYFFHYLRHIFYQLGGYPYRAGFRPVPRVIISRLSLRTFPGVTMRLCDLWTLTITFSDFVTICDYISHLTPHGFELMSWAQVAMWQPD